jgi:hypothetical protein
MCSKGVGGIGGTILQKTILLVPLLCTRQAQLHLVNQAVAIATEDEDAELLRVASASPQILT